MAEVVALIYFNGRKFQGSEGQMFEGEIRTTRIKHGMSMNNLMRKLQNKLKLGRNQLISSVTCRFLASNNPRQYVGLQVCDNEDVRIMMDTFAQQTFMNALELYVDIDQAGSSSVPAPPDVTNIQLPPHYDETYCGEEPESQAVTVPLSHDCEEDNNFNVDPDAYRSVDEDECDDDRILVEDSSDDERPMAPVSPSSPIHMEVPINVHPGTNDGPTVPFWNDIPHYTNINWDYPDQEPDRDSLALPDNWEAGDELYVGQRFDSKEAVQHALKHYALKIHQSFRVVESKPTVYYVKCPNSTEEHPCPWRMRAILSRRSTKWGITRWGGQHTCVNQMLSQDHSKCSSDFICSCIQGMVKQEPSISISLIQERVNGMFGYSVSYTKAWKAKQKALAKVFGDWEESYDELPRWLEYMLPFAPGSAYRLVTHDYRRNGVVDPHKRIFQRVFWAFKQCCEAFTYCKPIIQIDGTWLYGKYRGTLFIATTQDGNGNILPIAFAIVEGETLSAWSWFLRLIRLHVTARQGICLISDRHASIKSAVASLPEWQPPYAYHVYCIRHIASNFNHKFKNKQMKDELVDLELAKLEIQKEQPEQRLNFNGGDHPHPPPPHDHHHHHHHHHIAPPQLPRKRPWHHSNQGTAPGPTTNQDGHVKVYVAPVPRTASEDDIRLVFQEHGNIVEVVLLKDKRTGIRQGSCFVKYSTFNEADRAIKALNNQYTFVGESFPVVVKFADQQQRLGVRGSCRNLEKKDPSEVLVDKVFVSSINKEASHKEIEEIFSPYGHVEDVFIAPSRGYAFVKFSKREMALAAIKGLDRTFMMRGCDHPLVVRFAEPKKPKTGELRGNYVSGNANFGPCSQESVVWPQPNFGDPNTGGSIMPIAPHHSTILHPQVVSHMPNWEPGRPVAQQPFIPPQAHSQLASMPLQSIQPLNLSSQPFITEVQRQSHPADSSVQNIEQQLSFQLPNQTGSNQNTVASSTSPDLPTSPQDEELPECDWSEHFCPDGHKYYYNCATCESKWEKPEEYALYEKESQKQQEQKDNSFLLAKLSLSPSQEVAYRQQETNHDHWQPETSLVAG